MLLRVPLVLLASLAGIAVQFYIFHVERQLLLNPGYQAACDFASSGSLPPFIGSLLQGSSCTKVFSSIYARPLSHWGVVSPGSDFDLGLPWFGLVYFLTTLAFPIARRKFPNTAHKFYLALGIASAGFTIYLASILKFILQEFCIVCASTYVLNAICLGAFVLEYRAKEQRMLDAAGGREKKKQ
ncbi:unnamed protein product [Amoebophrya sp. A25]|nr:unnamed protein product [Amoebophrya sp. A25]|eukprot:GSA25T00003283001.1